MIVPTLGVLTCRRQWLGYLKYYTVYVIANNLINERVRI